EAREAHRADRLSEARRAARRFVDVDRRVGRVAFVDRRSVVGRRVGGRRAVRAREEKNREERALHFWTTRSSGGVIATRDPLGTLSVKNTEPPTMLPSPSVVSPPSTVAFA